MLICFLFVENFTNSTIVLTLFKDKQSKPTTTFSMNKIKDLISDIYRTKNNLFIGREVLFENDSSFCYFNRREEVVCCVNANLIRKIMSSDDSSPSSDYEDIDTSDDSDDEDVRRRGRFLLLNLMNFVWIRF